MASNPLGYPDWMDRVFLFYHHTQPDYFCLDLRWGTQTGRPQGVSYIHRPSKRFAARVCCDILLTLDGGSVPAASLRGLGIDLTWLYQQLSSLPE